MILLARRADRRGLCGGPGSAIDTSDGLVDSEAPMLNVARRRWMGIAAGAIATALFAPGSEAKAAAGLTFEVYEDAKKEFRWRLKSSNGQVIATSGQGYKAKADCKHAIEVIQKGAAEAVVDDQTAKKK
jgi:uncharacterized protein YegP (UPF0339 family)